VALVGLDVGTSAVKGVAIDDEGRVLATASADYPVARPHPGWSEQEPEHWWRAAKEVLARLPEGPVGLSGQMHGLVVLDSAQQVLRPAILWDDQRTAAECAEIEERIGFTRLVELTGNRALTGFTAPKLLWLRRHEPELYGRIRHVLLPKDYVRFRLSGELAGDAADASGTLLFDVRQRAWSRRSARRSRSRSNGFLPFMSRPRSPAPATRPRPRSGSESSARGRCRPSSAPPASSSLRSPPTNTTPKGGCMPSATPCPPHGTRWA
jgi:sugar (pentulose or hexulose) kinase